jgi:NADH:ubiquinone oxidoreductase subunit 5 (subunit L)/multisubunit Na+/H+ antiporter MnhA subunit
MILIAPVVPLLAAAAAWWFLPRRGSRWLLLVALLLAIAAAGWGLAGPTGELTIGWGPVLSLSLGATGFGAVMLLLIPAIAAPVIGYAYVTETAGRRSLVPLLLVFVATMELLVLSRDLLMLLVAWELVGALSWLLIGHRWRDPDPPAAARTAFITTRIGDLGLYAAAGILFAATGTFRLDAMASLDRPAADLVAAGLLIAAAAKSAQVPFGQWLFAAMAGPTPVSALLHSATLVAAGAYLLIVTSPLLPAVPWFLPAIALVGVVTVFAGGAVAGAQQQAKPALAGSTSAQYGLMFIAIGAGAPAIAGAQLVVHAAFKSLLFLGAGAAMHEVATGQLASMRLGRVRPVTAFLSAIGLLALAAVPFTGGGWSKEAIVVAAEERSIVGGVLVLASGALTAFYATRLGLLMWGPGQGDARHHQPLMVRADDLTMLPLALGTLALSVLWLPGGAAWLVGADGPGFEVISLALSLAAIVIGASAAVALDRRGTLLAPVGDSGADLADSWLGFIPLVQSAVARGAMRLSAALARYDARVVDAGVRGVWRLTRAASRVMAVRDVVTVDGAVRAVAAGTLLTADVSRVADERGVDGTIEGTGRAVGRAGQESRRLQTGMSHEYLQLIAAGLGVALIVLAVAR